MKPNKSGKKFLSNRAVKLPKNIYMAFVYLTCAEVAVFLFILCLSQRANKLKVRIKLSTIERECGITNADRIIDKLILHNFLKKQNCYIDVLKKDGTTERRYSASWYILEDNFLDLNCNYCYFPLDRIKELRHSSIKLLVYYISLSCGIKGECYPSLSRISHDTGLSRATIVKHNKLLEQLGYISYFNYYKAKNDRIRCNNRYYVKYNVCRAIGKRGWNWLQFFFSALKSRTLDSFKISVIKNIISEGASNARRNIVQNFITPHIKAVASRLSKAHSSLNAIKAKAVSCICSIQAPSQTVAQKLNFSLQKSFDQANKKAICQLNRGKFSNIYFFHLGVV